MSRDYAISKDNSGDFYFAKLALMSGAITQAEFRRWLYYIIEAVEKPPTYFFDIIDLTDMREIFKGPRNGPLGFNPQSDLSDVEMLAVDGIAFRRGHFDGVLNFDLAISRHDALRALEENPHIERRFQELFPFIELNG